MTRVNPQKGEEHHGNGDCDEYADEGVKERSYQTFGNAVRDICRQHPAAETGDDGADEVDDGVDLFPHRHGGDLVFALNVVVGRDEADVCEQRLYRVAAG